MPPAFCALEALVMQEWEQEVWRSYQSEMMRMIATGLGAKNLPKFETLIDVSDAKEMTPEQVAQQRARLLEKLNAG